MARGWEDDCPQRALQRPEGQRDSLGTQSPAFLDLIQAHCLSGAKLVSTLGREACISWHAGSLAGRISSPFQLECLDRTRVVPHSDNLRIIRTDGADQVREDENFSKDQRVTFRSQILYGSSVRTTHTKHIACLVFSIFPENHFQHFMNRGFFLLVEYMKAAQAQQVRYGAVGAASIAPIPHETVYHVGLTEHPPVYYYLDDFFSADYAS